jgi:hypothetical protein
MMGEERKHKNWGGEIIEKAGMVSGQFCSSVGWQGLVGIFVVHLLFPVLRFFVRAHPFWAIILPSEITKVKREVKII